MHTLLQFVLSNDENQVKLHNLEKNILYEYVHMCI